MKFCLLTITYKFYKNKELFVNCKNWDDLMKYYVFR